MALYSSRVLFIN